MRYLIDSNILLRLVQPSDPDFVLMRLAIRRLKRRGNELYITPQTLAEFWNVATRPATARGGYGLSLVETNRKLGLLLRRFTLLEDQTGITSRWRHLLVKYGVSGVAVHDTRLVASMLLNGLTHILTLNDTDFTRFTEITPIHPRAVL